MGDIERPTRDDWLTPDGAGPALRECLLAATAAPSIHNTQPWLFRPRKAADGAGVAVVDVLVDRGRQLAALDPEGREMFMSVGAALFNLRVAVHARGRRAGVRLTPDPAEPDLAARVTIGAEVPVLPAARALAEAIPRRHTNRRPFEDRPVPYGTLEELSGAATAEGASLLVADVALRSGVLSVTRTAENRMRTDPAYRAELAAWTTPGGVGRRDGVPRQAFGPRDTDAAMPLRDFAFANGAPSAVTTFEREPTVLLLFTPGDTPADWLRAGAAMERLLLTATVRGLAATPMSQITEISALRRLLAETPTSQVVQTVLRIGYATTPAVATPRRPVADVVVVPAARARSAGSEPGPGRGS